MTVTTRPEPPGNRTRTSASTAFADVEGGEMGRLIAELDWTATQLGPIDGWSPALRMMVRFLLPNRFPMLLWWGPRYISIYNDPYRPILGTKHPDALGKPVDEVWSEIWDILRPLIDTPFNGGPATWNEDIELVLNRFGYPEETHFTIAYSPVPDDTAPNGIGGVLATVNEITQKVVGERRVATLRDLASQDVLDGQELDPCGRAAAVLGRHAADVPFALLYLAEEGEPAELCATAGVAPGAAAPQTIGDAVASGPWPVQEVLDRGRPIMLDDLERRLGVDVPAGPFPERPSAAVLLPIPSAIPLRPAGVLVAGVSGRLQLDDAYRGFLELVAGQIGTSLAQSRAYQEERRRAEALAELDRAKTAFFSNVSHEFRTPLTMMLGPIQDLLDPTAEPLTRHQRDELLLADRSSRRLLRLVNALLDFSRIEAGRADLSFEPTDLAGLTADLASQFRSAIERAGLALEVDVDPALGPVHVDRDMWEKIVLNLLSNALKATFDGWIRVRLAARDGAAELEVEDSGVGIPEAEVTRIFERFHRVENARSRTYEGTGIGLSLVQELVRLHGGQITVASTPDVGTTFRVRIPLGSGHLPPERIAAARRLEATALDIGPFVDEAMGWLPERNATIDATEEATPTVAIDAVRSGSGASPLVGDLGVRILVADDNADMRRYLGRLLGRHWTVEVVADGDAALEAIRERSFDLVLSDVMMPGVDGLELLARLRADAATRDVPVLLVSARAGEDARIEGAAAGADDYIVKPFSARELVARVDGALRLAHARRLAREELKASNDQLQIALAVKDEFLGLVSHELRTPLTVILGMSKVLERIGASDLRARELVADVAESADVLNGLVESMLLLARLDRDEAAVLREPVLLHHAATRILEERGRRDPTRAYVLQDYDTDGVVLVQPTWLERVIDNLVGNAAKYSDPGTPIEVTIEVDEREARLRVLDHGPGLDDEERAKVFDPFYRSTVARERAAGAGLGLAVAKRIVELLGGRIWVGSSPSGGCEFGFALPVAEEGEP